MSKWAVMDCSKTPSAMNCKVKMMAPMEEKDALVDLGVYHAIKTHGDEDTPELKDAIREGLEYEDR